MQLKRIEFIHSLGTKDIVYDLCCDHGHIGALFLKENKITYFIDQVQEIAQKLNNKYSNNENAHIVCDSILKLKKLKDNSTIIIAGVGSKLLEAFLKLNLINHTHEIIISTHSNQHIAYQAMANSNLKRQEEYILEDQGRYYEIFKCKLEPQIQNKILINKDFSKIINSVYYQKQLKFYEHKAQDPLCRDLYEQLRSHLT